MRFRTILFAPLLLTAAIAAATPTTRPAHDRDPWIFRCVLDNNARMVVISLGNDVWAAYDANRCTLAKLWVGDVEFTGTVFDTKHGPQPKARGTMLLERPTAVEPQKPGATTRSTAAQIDGWRGYRIDHDRATLNFDFNGITIDETLFVTDIDAEAKTITVRRTITVDGPISAETPITLESPRSAAVKQTTYVTSAVDAKGAAIALKTPSQMSIKPESNFGFTITQPGTFAIDTVYSTEQK